MKIKAIDICNDTWKCLENTSGLGEVHSVYHKVINIKIDNRILGVGINKTEKSPDFIRVDYQGSFSDFKIERQQKVALNNKLIKIGNEIEIELTQCIVYELNKHYKRDWEKLDSELYIKITNLLKIYGKKSQLYYSLLDSSGEKNSLTNMFKEKMQKFVEHVNHGETDLADLEVFEVLGLGIGLTPSGDDFISGYILLRTCFNEKNKRFLEHAELYRKSTNEISFQMICNSCMGMARESELELIKAYSEGDWNSIKKHFFKVLDYGSTSGTDTILGILYAIKTMSIKYWNNK